MRKIIIGLFFILASVYATSSESIPSEEKVLICVSPNSYAYHSHYCQGLKRYTHEVKEVTIDEAKRMGRKPCKYCY
jgi:hypothetical protein